ncbi:type VI secretion system-associated protein VasI [Vibrio europaeus]|nr:type VI secretion system-associated protein VasI [Vibrio europaeus]MDC5803557.1 type VI secretion system-associated protein VasI [Vibrio europaeus]MDC5810544.1 type VI secretion system-associated protein VasI [Vibrio europaeus]MDC5823429.1 type VI secretion system-associated protein VasI [Vibrio europaeus]MDC5828733.1 type VI secretion system-associated protein VasI [Vibrio europaeus]MDC5833162.1 type VI secretion system-associated protein VasI [Vibrio europaeus]
MMKLNSLALVFTTSLFVTGASATDTTTNMQLEKAQQCTSVSERLDRLSCFDEVFQTPTVSNLAVKHDDRPPAWHTAFESSKGNEPLNVVEKGTEKEGDAWVTVTAKHADGVPSPVLMMSCINKISRIELALPQAMEDARIRVSVAGGPNQSWRSDDIGVLFSSARGVPAISMMKVMSRESRLTLRSNSPVVDGLQFDTTGLSQALKPLRSRCGW